MAATWDNLPPDMKHAIFAALSLLDLGRAARTSRELRAAYRARLAAVHSVAIQAAVSSYGEAFPRAHSTIIQRLRRGLPPFTGCGSSVRADILSDGTLRAEFRPHAIAPASTAFRGVRRTSGGVAESVSFMVWNPSVHTDPTFELKCETEGDHLRFCVKCDAVDCQEVTAAFAAICEYLEVDSRATSPPGERGALTISACFVFMVRRPPGHLNDAKVNGIAAALLPIWRIVPRLSFYCKLHPAWWSYSVGNRQRELVKACQLRLFRSKERAKLRNYGTLKSS